MKRGSKVVVPFVIVSLGLMLQVSAGKAPSGSLPGFIDGAEFLEAAGAAGATVEVSLHGALLKSLVGVDPELKKLAGGLESIHAVIVQPEDVASRSRVRDLMRETERKLLDKGWERLARIKDGETNVVVLVVNEEDAIQGLVVMVAEEGEGQFVFANVAGIIDLAAIAALGEQLEIPGLEQMDDEE